MSFWQILIIFWIVGISSRVDYALWQDEDFSWWLRLIISTILILPAWVLMNVWVGITW